MGYRCVAAGCRKFSKVRTTARVLKHAMRCVRMDADQRAVAVGEAVSMSASSRLEQARSESAIAAEKGKGAGGKVQKVAAGDVKVSTHQQKASHHWVTQVSLRLRSTCAGNVSDQSYPSYLG
ncbi:hypothetical protein CYLTODRAFT_260062 [Cylindrobasidium torrendii FP15055 ss-10]|uniref:Uncharacterized protein n=1 Tax=Cylindrobasidium torrendii FP15055 ss-10 TaxID=1314674 RepID=A0A0D7ART8_9AGAR|nr:hypothetical protein CYLTODRAFT_260062 [Cylindrobasidium torrendii FP15055 ss-10]